MYQVIRILKVKVREIFLVLFFLSRFRWCRLWHHREIKKEKKLQSLQIIVLKVNRIKLEIFQLNVNNEELNVNSLLMEKIETVLIQSQNLINSQRILFFKLNHRIIQWSC